MSDLGTFTSLRNLHEHGLYLKPINLPSLSYCLVSVMLPPVNILNLKMMLLWSALFAVCFHSYSASRKCDYDELQCDDGSCIKKLQWCDPLLEVDCEDGSDENYCNGTIPCNQMLHFECENKKCIPIIAACDHYDDCYDNSDEKSCNGSSLLKNGIVLMDEPAPREISLSKPKSFHDSISFLFGFNSGKEAALDQTVKYFLSQENSDDGWGSFTPRAIVALSMASKESQTAEKSKQLMMKHLNIHLFKDLMKNEDATLSSLALYINALHATCQDPRNYQGIDLVARLRTETDSAVKLNATIPLAYLTLCLSNATKPEDNFKLAELYNSRENDMRTGSKSLIMLAMTCIMNKDRSRIFEEYVSDFFSDLKVVENADIYTKALFIQASIAAGSSHSFEIAGQQLPDGSFGDMLSTYYAIPVLMNSSLLDLICKNPKGSGLEFYTERREGLKEVTYSLWIPYGKDVVSHTITVPFYGNKSFFYLMNIAASKDALYRFLFDELDPEGIRVYSIAGIPNDVESGKYWVLYAADSDNVKVNSVEELTLLDIGVDHYFPGDKDHLIFWLKRSL